ncbi:MAG TPA: cytochrome P450 [Acidimicrobiales bacterium]|nr:cytochrome P450 [Acidimicrobiales bacterium]
MPTAEVSYDPYDYAIHEDPYPTYARMREETPAYHNAERGFWALSRHADVMDGFRDNVRYSNEYGVSIDPAAWGPHAHRSASFLAMDPPRHDRMRALVSRAFTPRRVALLEDDVRTLTRKHLGPALDQPTFDMVGDLAGKLPMDVVSELIGVPEADRDQLRGWADLLLHREPGIDDIPPAGAAAALSLASYYADLVADRRKHPHEDLTSALLDAELDGDRLSDDDVIGFLSLMVVAGNETTTKLLANAWYWAWRFPEQRAIPFGDPARIPAWVEETLRFDTSSQLLARRAVVDVSLHGTTIPAGGQVLLLAGSANRDPRVFDDPDEFRIGRDTQGLASFGMGRHHCLGASLARLEARVCLEELVGAVADYEIDEAGAKRVHSVNVRGFATLPTRAVRR